MFSIEDLFESRVIFATRLLQYMETHGIIKADLSEKANLSRPTLNKVLTGEITNRTNFVKHVEKILFALEVTPDQIMGNVSNPFNHLRDLKKILHITDSAIAEATCISLKRLEEIELGEKADLSELRDIAFCCYTSVRCLSGTYFFEPPLNSICRYDKKEMFSGFWGHVGVLLSTQKNYQWFPITREVSEHIRREMNQEYMIIPCMDNNLLLLNMKYVDNLILLDDACDQPSFTNWDNKVSNGEIPLVVYEALEDWIYEDYKENPTLLSDKFIAYLQRLVDKMDWNEQEINKIVNGITIYFGSGNMLSTCVDFDEYTTIGWIVQEIYEFGDNYVPDDKLCFTDMMGVESITGIERVAMICLPLLKTEDCICRGYEED